MLFGTVICRKNGNRRCVHLNIDSLSIFPEKKKTGRKPGPSNVESWSLSKTKDFIQSVRNTVMNDLNPDIELKEYGITESNFGRIVREAKARIQKEDNKYVVFEIPRGKNPYLPQNKSKWA